MPCFDAYLKMKKVMHYHLPLHKGTLKGAKKNLENLELIDKSQLHIETTFHKKLLISAYLVVMNS